MKFEFYAESKKIVIDVLECRNFFSKFKGLMFRKNSKPLLFIFNSEKKLEIHSLFCRPFIAIWIDERKNVTRIEKIEKWRLKFSGYGKYLIEIPLDGKMTLDLSGLPTNDKLTTEKKEKHLNRKNAD